MRVAGGAGGDALLQGEQQAGAADALEGMGVARGEGGVELLVQGRGEALEVPGVDALWPGGVFFDAPAVDDAAGRAGYEELAIALWKGGKLGKGERLLTWLCRTPSASPKSTRA